MEYENMLAEAGLTGWEARTYLALLKLGSTTTGPLVKKCGVPHSKIYGVLESLNNKGLASYVIKGKVKHFQASDPGVILSMAKDRERRVAESLPGLRQLALRAKHRQKVEIYEGMKSITRLFIGLIDACQKGDDWYGFSVGEDEKLEKVQLFWNRIGSARFRGGLNVKAMTPIKNKKMYETAFKDRMRYIRKFIRYSGRAFPATTVILGDKIIILNFMSETETAVVITSKDLVRFYKEFYVQEWEAGKGY